MSESISIPPKQFTNWYEVLGVSRTATQEDLARAYQSLSVKFRPDNKETGDARRYQEVKSAFQLLSNTERRKGFDQELPQLDQEPTPGFLTKEFMDDVDTELSRRLGILCLLYNQRKTNPINPSLSIPQLEAGMSTGRENLEFSIWYLKQKRLVLSDDRSTLIILCEGIDWLEENLPREKSLQKLQRQEKEMRQNLDIDRVA
jgi:curved DNA-binding protein CbpA